MANTTDFYTLPNRIVYINSGTQEKATVSLYPSVPDRVLTTNHSLVIDYGSEQVFSYIYLKHSNILRLVVYKDTDLNGTQAPDNPIGNFSDPGDSGILTLTNKTTAQYLRFVTTPDTGKTVNWKALVPCDQLLSFPDGAFNQINFKPTNPTRGKHRMMSGGVRPFQGLGIQKRKMLFGAEEVPYEWKDSVEKAPANINWLDRVDNNFPVNPTLPVPNNTNPGWLQEWEREENIRRMAAIPQETLVTDDDRNVERAKIVKGLYPDDPLFYKDADLTKINGVFQNNLKFLFADNLDDYPDRIFPACFDETELDEPFTNTLKHIGYNVSFTVCEL